MTLQTLNHSYLYTYKFDYHHSELCKLESRQIFDVEERNKVLFSNIHVDPSISPFIKNRLEILSSSETFVELLKSIQQQNIVVEGFKAEYLNLEGDATSPEERNEKLKDVGCSIVGIPNFELPSITYAVCTYEGIWCFGVLVEAKSDWRKHKQKPCSFSNSICMIIAKTLVSIASKGNKTKALLDACCGVGTVLLEGCVSEFNIEGSDINLKASNHAKENLEYYNYQAQVLCADIKDVSKAYDAIIIDLPYNLYSHSTDEITLHIIESAAQLTNRTVIVSISDIELLIKQSGLKITDFCTVKKRGKSTFTRNIWVCVKDGE
ncbi:MAG: tRNA (guanine10-N2)-dimethyltransferase [Bacteroidia bacterium]